MFRIREVLGYILEVFKLLKKEFEALNYILNITIRPSLPTLPLIDLAVAFEYFNRSFIVIKDLYK